MYILTSTEVVILNIDGKIVNRFPHNRATTGSDTVAMVNNQIIIPDLTTKCLSAYSERGQLLKTIFIEELHAGKTYLCGAGSNTVIISQLQYVINRKQFLPAQILSINVYSGQVVERLNVVPGAAGMAYHSKSQSLLVSTVGSVSVINSNKSQ